MNPKHVLLLGGAGYIGEHVAKELVSRGHAVTIVDESAPQFSLEYCEFVSADRAYKLTLVPRDTVFVNLACPRNKPGAWDFRAAEKALDLGLHLGGLYHVERRIFISSMSVDDEPDNEYAQFKRMAERVCTSYAILRLGTVFGARDGHHYRADLGLHQIARALAGPAPHTAWVGGRVRRYVAPIDLVVRSIVRHIEFPDYGGKVFKIHAGAAKFRKLVPGVEPKYGLTYYSCPDDAPEMHFKDKQIIREQFVGLVEAMKNDRVYPC